MGRYEDTLKDLQAVNVLLEQLSDKVREIIENQDETKIEIPDDISVVALDDVHRAYSQVLAQEQFIWGMKERTWSLRLVALDAFYAADDLYRDKYDQTISEGLIDASMSWEERASKVRTLCMDELIIQRRGERSLERIDDLVVALDGRLKLLERISFNLHNISRLMSSERILRSAT